MLWLFFCYGLLGWVLETAYAALRQRRYVDRSVLFGPLCLSYGLTGAVLTWGLWELRGRYFFLFLGCAVGATVVEWAAGHLLERATRTRWWDYSARRFNLDGYICAGASAVWGLLGLAAVQWVSPLLVSLYRLLPPLAGHILLWVLVGVLAVDGLGTILTLAGVRETLPQMEAVNSRLAALSIRMGEWILRRTEGRIQRTYPKARFARREEAEKVKIITGGPMMGLPVESLDAPVVKNTSSLICLADWERRDEGPETVCIRCGKCVAACPMHLAPAFIGRALREGDRKRLARLHVEDCIHCGCCSFICPARIPLVELVRQAAQTLEKGGEA